MKGMKNTLAVAIAVALLPFDANAEDVAVFPTRTQSGSGAAQSVTRAVETGVADAASLKGLEVLAGNTLRSSIVQSGLSTNCSDYSCEIATAKSIGATLVVSSSLVNFEGRWLVELTVHDTLSGQTLASHQAQAGSISQLASILNTKAKVVMAMALKDSSRTALEDDEPEAKSFPKSSSQRSAPPKRTAPKTKRTKTKPTKTKPTKTKRTKTTAVDVGIKEDAGLAVAVRWGIIKPIGAMGAFTSMGQASRVEVVRKADQLSFGGAIQASTHNVANYEEQAVAGCYEGNNTCFVGDYSLLTLSGVARKAVVDNPEFKVQAQGTAGVAFRRSPVIERYYVEEVVEYWNGSRPTREPSAGFLPALGGGIDVAFPSGHSAVRFTTFIGGELVVGHGASTQFVIGLESPF